MQLLRADDFAHGDVDLRFHHHHLVRGLLPERVRAFNIADALADVERGGASRDSPTYSVSGIGN